MDPYVAKVIRLLDQNKAIAAFLAPFAIGLLGTIANWIVTGDFNTNELRLAAAGSIGGLGAALAVYKTPTKTALVDVAASRPLGEPTVHSEGH